VPNPYPGPRPFNHQEHAIFAGRDHELAELTSLIVAHRVVLLHAQSGAGKTSIVNAGLAHSLAERDARFLPVARVGIPVPTDIPISEIANVYTFSVGCDILPEIPQTDPWRRGATLLGTFARLPPVVDEAGDPRLTVCAFDQFEELFTVHPARWADREKFFDEVASLCQERRDIHILFVLREDFLASFNQLAGRLPEGGRTCYRIERLREEEAVAAIRKPLNATPLAFGPSVAETMARDLMRITVASTAGEVVGVQGEFVEPVQLQVVCYNLLERLPPATTTITLELYRKFGDPDEALESFYEQALAAALASTSIDEGQLRDWFERSLITPAGTRGLVYQDRHTTGGIPNRVVEVLEQRHIVRPEIRSGSRWYELTHDRFIRPVQRANLAWKTRLWSGSFEAKYATAIHSAVSRTGVREVDLRGYLDTLVAASGCGQSRPAPGATGSPVSGGGVPPQVSESVLDLLVEAGLLRREPTEGQVLYSPLHDGHAQSIRIANQNWRARTSPQAAALRELEDRAARWARASADRAKLAMTRTELREANRVLAAARLSAITVSEDLVEFVGAGAASVAKVNLRIAGVFGGVFTLLVAFSRLAFVPDSLALRLLFLGVTGLGACGMGWAMNDDDDVIARSVAGVLILYLVAASVGIVVAGILPGLTLFVRLPVSFLLGFLVWPFMLGVASSSGGTTKPAG
jgi:hypothetical protein